MLRLLLSEGKKTLPHCNLRKDFTIEKNIYSLTHTSTHIHEHTRLTILTKNLFSNQM